MFTYLEPGRKKYFFYILIFIFTLLGLTSETRADITTGLVGHWKFDEGSGITASDASGNGNSGIISGTTWTNGKIGDGALNFDGSGDSISIPYSPSFNPSESITISFWIKINDHISSSVTGGIIQKNASTDYRVRMVSTNALQWLQGGSTIFSSSNNLLAPNEWVHVVLVSNSSGSTFYRNGSSWGNTATPYIPPSSSASLLIGNAGFAPGFTLDDTRIYNRSLTSSEVTELFNLGGGSYATPYATPYLTPQSPPSNTYYIRDGGTSSSCTDWLNACDTLPATLQRGATYYIADGSYAPYIFDDAVSGNQLITIKKATVSEHGTDTGWSNSYGEGQAVFTGGLVFSTNYWVFDGQSRTSWKSGHGFKVTRSGNPGQGVRLNADNITIQYVEIEGNGPDDGGSPADDGVYAILSQSNLQFRYLYLHDFGRAPFILRGLNNLILEHSFIARNESFSSQHSEGVSLFGGDGTNDNNIFRFNIWEDIEGTGVIVVGNGSGNQFYGNLIYWTSHYPNPGQAGSYVSNGSITSWSAETQNNGRFYNNTIIVPPSGGLNFATTNNGMGAGNLAYNNLYFSSGSIAARITYNPGTAHNYNAYSGSDGEGEANSQVGILSSLFADALNYDFRLATPTQTGTALESPYNLDLWGLTRGSDGIWDRGAYEYVTGGTGGDEPGEGVYATPSSGGGGGGGSASLTEETKQALIIQIMLQIIELLTQLIIKLKSGAAAVVSALSGWGIK